MSHTHSISSQFNSSRASDNLFIEESIVEIDASVHPPPPPPHPLGLPKLQTISRTSSDGQKQDPGGDTSSTLKSPRNITQHTHHNNT